MNIRSAAQPMMAWHIFKKDLRLLWPLALGTMLGQTLLTLLQYHPNVYAFGKAQQGVAGIVTLGLVIGLSLLIVLTVQQDVTVEVDQDWRVRPIHERDLLLAKLLSLVLLVLAPICALDLLRGLAEGLPFGPMLRAALLANFQVAMIFALPLMAIAALTRSITEALLGGLAVAFGLVLLRLFLTYGLHLDYAVNGTGVEWVWRSLGHTELLWLTVAVLLLQYFGRRTHAARALFVGGLVVYVMIPALPWRPAFAVQQGLSANADAASSITLAFDASRHLAEADVAHTDPQLLAAASDDDDKKSKKSDKDSTRLLLPLGISGLSAGSILHADRSTLRILDANGRKLWRGTSEPFDLRSENGQALFYSGIRIPNALYRKLADQTLRVEMDASLTLLQAQAALPLLIEAGDQSLPGMGHCASRVGDDGKTLEVGCLKAGELPSCRSLRIEQADGTRGVETFDCDLDYRPAFLNFSSDAVDHSLTKLPLRDTATPADTAMLRGEHVLVSAYEPVAHFTRRVELAQIRLRDWQAPRSEQSRDDNRETPE